MIRTRATLAAALVLLTACVSMPGGERGVDHEHVGSVRIELPGHGLVDVPLDGAALAVGESPGMAELCPDAARALGVPGVYYGSSGAPVRVDGRLVGGLSATTEHDQSVYGLGFAPIDAIRRWLRVGRAWSADADVGPLLDGDAPMVYGGTTVRFLTLWGDLSEDAVGTVTFREGDDVTLLAHGPDGRPQGGRHRLLQQAPPVAFEGAWRRGARGEVQRRTTLVAGTGPAVGRVYFESAVGLVGEIGALPPHFRVDVTVRAGDAPVFRLELYVAANERTFREQWKARRALDPWARDVLGCTARLRDPDAGEYLWRSPGANDAQNQWYVVMDGERLDRCLARAFETADAGDHVRLEVRVPIDAEEELR